MDKSVEEMARELEKEIFWKYEKYSPEVQHKVCMVSGAGLAIEATKFFQSQIDKAVLDGKIEELNKLNEDWERSYGSKLMQCSNRITELKSKREKLNGEQPDEKPI